MGSRAMRGSSDQEHSLAHPKHSKPVGPKGQPTFKNTVPGYDHASGTPKWAAGPARKAAGRAK